MPWDACLISSTRAMCFCHNFQVQTRCEVLLASLWDGKALATATLSVAFIMPLTRQHHLSSGLESRPFRVAISDALFRARLASGEIALSPADSDHTCVGQPQQPVLSPRTPAPPPSANLNDTQFSCKRTINLSFHIRRSQSELTFSKMCYLSNWLLEYSCLQHVY